MKVYKGKLEKIVKRVNNYHSIDWTLFSMDSSIDVDSNQIGNYVDLDSLNVLIKDFLKRKKFDIQTLIDEDEIAGSIYTSKDGLTKILHLDSDSDYYRFTLCLFIDLNSGETFISDM